MASSRSTGGKFNLKETIVSGVSPGGGILADQVKYARVHHARRTGCGVPHLARQIINIDQPTPIWARPACKECDRGPSSYRMRRSRPACIGRPERHVLSQVRPVQKPGRLVQQHPTGLVSPIVQRQERGVNFRGGGTTCRGLETGAVEPQLAQPIPVHYNDIAPTSRISTPSPTFIRLRNSL